MSNVPIFNSRVEVALDIPVAARDVYAVVLIGRMWAVNVKSRASRGFPLR